MPKQSPIIPVISKKDWKNKFEHWDADAKRWIRCAGYRIDIWDPLTKSRYRFTEHVDYKTALMLHRQWQDAAARGKFGKIARTKKSGVVNLMDLFNSWKKEVAGSTFYRDEPLSPETIRRTSVAIKAFNLALGIGEERSIQLKQITLTKIEKFIRVRLAQGVSKAGVNADNRQLRALLGWGKKKEFLDENPFRRVEFFRIKKSKPRALIANELLRLFEVCPPASKYYNLLMFYLITGARRSQAAKPLLTWDCIDFEKGYIYLAKQKRQERTFPITPELKDILLDLKTNPIEKLANHRSDDHLYPFPFCPSHISNKIIKPMLLAAGIPDVSLHNLRKTCLTVLRNDLGYSTENVKDFIGHSSIQVTEAHYLGTDYEGQRQMASDLGEYLVTMACRVAKSEIGAERLVERPKTVPQNSAIEVSNPPVERLKDPETGTSASHR
ncbi:MAG: tyrosine-type recombinase/integrase [Candidatus Marinimicrobia bacterium]|nr:tyrosine-type recombinase/integrase [Candidatus Neomarinimicrobiota bacterium]